MDEKMYTRLDNIMDQVAGDVLNYVQGVGRAFPEDSERNRQLARNVDEIRDRFFRPGRARSKTGMLGDSTSGS